KTDFDGIVICSTTAEHRDLVARCVGAGKPIFVEKPMGMNGDDSAAIAGLLTEAGVPFSTGYFRRGDGQVRKLRRLVQEGAFGTVTRARFSNCHSGALGGWFDSEWRWMADLSRAGVGAFGDLGTHVLDLALWMFGSPDRAVGSLQAGTNRYPGCEEYGEAIFAYDSGLLVTLAAGWNDVADPCPIQLMATGGHALICNGSLMVKIGDGPLEEVEGDEGAPAGFSGFVDYVVTGEGELVLPTEALARDRAMSAVYRSNESGRWESVVRD
ncbi:MAG: Gfo/Idh/MocA family oxidoreductase, partial [Fimbriimonadaceae bacterium]|nr:Gfo/Idh/MocA family oxidoreductase [Fimbriimonadaceae bacterium]